MKIDYAAYRRAIDDAIRTGRKDLARQTLRELMREKVPRDHALAIASLARRANEPSVGVRLLNPLVRAEGKVALEASPAEKAEYAACLIRIGAGEEALALLSALDGESHPEVLLYRTFALVSRWDYEASIPLLERYLSHPAVTDYSRLVGKSNLAAAYVAQGRDDDADRLLAELLDETRRGGHTLLYGTAIELSARNAIARRDWGRAEEAIAEVERRFEGSADLNAFYARKWRCLVALFRDETKHEAVAMLRALRDEAARLEHWETLRECDRYEAVARHDVRLLTHVYFGTGHEAYRRSVLHEFGDGARVPDEYLWELAGKASPAKTLDLFEGRWAEREGELKAGQVVHRLFVALATDFYRPLRLAAVHYLLYPAEYFNPHSSPNRVHRAIHRFREWCAASAAPFRIDEKSSTYRLAASKACGIRIAHVSSLADAEKVRLDRLRERYGRRDFSTQEAVRALGSSRSAVQRLLKEAEESGSLARSGRGPRTRFRFAA